MPADQTISSQRPGSYQLIMAGSNGFYNSRLYGRELAGIGDVLNEKGRANVYVNYNEILRLSGYTSLGFTSVFLGFMAFHYLRRKYFRTN